MTSHVFWDCFIIILPYTRHSFIQRIFCCRKILCLKVCDVIDGLIVKENQILFSQSKVLIWHNLKYLIFSEVNLRFEDFAAFNVWQRSQKYLWGTLIEINPTRDYSELINLVYFLHYNIWCASIFNCCSISCNS